MKNAGGLIVSLAEGSFGERLGLQVGDRLLSVACPEGGMRTAYMTSADVMSSVNGRPLRDVIDFQFYGAEEEVTVTVQRAGDERILAGSRDYGEAWGVEFAEPLFDGIRTCANRCPFCFVTGLPPGLRPSLYIHDDDYRLSFLFGNFSTLTNLTQEDWERLAEQALSPLYVSVQATEPDLRRRLLGGRPIPDILEQLQALGDLGITVHAQVVICPGLNDGPALERTVSDLWRLCDTVESVALVPVGLTRHHPARLQPMTVEKAAEILTFAAGWRRMAYRAAGRRFVYPSDEIYLLAGQPAPGAATYDGFPQLANGVGLVRRFLDNWAYTQRRLARRGVPAPAVRSATFVSGQLFLPFLAKVAEGLSRILDIRCQAWPVANRFFGEDVTVAGLLTGQDVVQQLAGRDLGERVILPRSMFDAAGERTLDDWTPQRIAAALATPVEMAGLPGEVAGILTGTC